MVSTDKDSKQFLQLFVDDYIKKLILLRYVFGIKYLIIIKYIEVPKKLTIEKFYQCEKFIDKYSTYLELSFNKCVSYNYLCDIMNIFELYFGGKSEYNKVSDILKKIHEPHIMKGLVKLNKNYPIFFPKTTIDTTVSFYKLSVFRELFLTDTYFYRLSYNNYNWSLYKIINYSICEILFTSVAIEKIIVYFRLILRKS